MPSTPAETIVCVAVEFADGIVSLPPPYRHHHVIQRHHSTTGISGSGLRQGFLTNTGRFVDRTEAAKIAHTAGQIAEPKPWLFSEDLW